MQQKQNQKIKIEDSTQNKKMTRAALAKRNQQTQQQLRKDQIYVRLTPKTQNCLQWMLCNRNFPRIQCKLSCNQHLQYLVNYLSNKWLRNKGNFKIILYPDAGTYLKNTLAAKDREKVIKQPLNNYFMFTDVMAGCGIGQNGNLNLNYDILQKKKETHLRNPTLINNELKNNCTQKLGIESIKKISQIYDQKLIRSNPSSDKQREIENINNKNSTQKYLPVNIINNMPLKNTLKVEKNNHDTQQKYNFFLNSQNPNSDNFELGNQSNLLNPNRNIYHDQQSIFKSIGFFGVGSGCNSIGFAKKNDYNLMSINSNSYLDIQNENTNKKDINSKGQNNIVKIESSNSKNFQEKQKQQKLKGFSQLKEQALNEIKKTNKLNELRNAINFVEVAEGFNDELAVKDQISQKSLLKQIKTVSIKKKTAN